MKILQQANAFIEQFPGWASTQMDILAVALIGSHARNAARTDSDIDLVIITDVPEKYLSQTNWVGEFGVVTKQQIEDYGMLRSLRVWYESGLEVEYGFTTRAWAGNPLDQGSRKTIEDGIQVLFERIVLLSPYEARRV